jgi:hypothetical protein
MRRMSISDCALADEDATKAAATAIAASKWKVRM